MAMRAAIAINCTVHEHSASPAKLFLSDCQGLPDLAIRIAPGHRGWLEIEVHGEKKRIGITAASREDAGNRSTTASHIRMKNLRRFQRCGTPLSEIVSDRTCARR